MIADGAAQRDRGGVVIHEFPAQAYVYRARCVRVVDADTLDLLIDCGFYLSLAQRVRLLDVWAPEIRGPERARGLVASAFVSHWIALRLGEWPLRIVTEKDDAFGRFLAVIWDAATGECLNDAVVASGNATVIKLV